MPKSNPAGSWALAVLCTLAGQTASADYTVFENEQQKLEIGLRLALQHNRWEVDDEGERMETRDSEVRRLRPELKYRALDWRAKLSWELRDESSGVRDLFIEYRGIDSLRVKLGQDTLPFSRARMTSSAEGHFAERGLADENNWGSPGRLPGAQLEYHLAPLWTVQGAIARADVYSDGYSEIRFLSPWENSDLDARLPNEGWMLVLRSDHSVNREVAYAQGDFKREPAATLSFAGFLWRADEDAPTLYDHYAEAEGLEIALAMRASGFAFDVQHHVVRANINANKLDEEIKQFLGADNPSLSSKLLHNNRAQLALLNLDLGYMLIEDTLEIAARYQQLSAASEDKAPSLPNGSTWQRSWTLQEIGLNYFLDKHDHKISLSLREESGIQGREENATGLILQWQYIY